MGINNEICCKCGHSVPLLERPARYCVHCCQILRQLCPYENDESRASDSDWVLLRDEAGNPPIRCPACERFLLHCPVCHRLHRISDTACKNRCDRPLAESGISTPSPAGSLDGRRAVRWCGTFTPRNRPDVLSQSFPFPDEPLAILYRYGKLLVFTEEMLRLVEWRDAAWDFNCADSIRFSQQSIELNPNTPIFVEAGKAFILGQQQAPIIGLELPALLPIQSEIGVPRWQAVQRNQCAMIFDVGGKGRLRVEDLHGSRLPVDEHLPVTAASIQGFLFTPHGLVLATSDPAYPLSLLRVEENGLDVAPIANCPPCHWRQLAWRDDRLLALAVEPAQADNLQLHLIDLRQRAQVDMRPCRGCLSRFAWAGDLVLLPGDGGAMLYDLRQFTQAPTPISMVEGEDATAEIWALRDNRDAINWVVVRQNSAASESDITYEVYLVGQDQERLIPLANGLRSVPLFCATDQGLVVAGKGADDQFMLRTITFEGS